MIEKEKKNLILTTSLCLCPILFGIIMLPKLPNQIAIHFDVNNHPDGYAPKEFFVFFFPIFMAVMNNICVLSSKYDKNKAANKRMHLVSQWIFPILSIVMYTVTILIALEYPIDIRVVCMILVGLMFIVLGNYLPKTKNSKSNFGIHIGFNKNLDDKTYALVARISGYVMILNGLLLIGSLFFKPIVSVYIVSLFIIEGVVLSVYTFKKSYQK